MEKLYDQLKSKSSQKLPPKEKFVATLSAQIEAQKKKHPGKKVELKVQKDESGKLQVKIRTKSESK